MSLSGTPEFARQLEEIGIGPSHVDGARVRFAYTIEVGRFAGQEVTLAFEVPENFPLTPPSGPHVSPRLLPLNPSANTHPQKVLESNFGPEFEYWSRPYTDWGKDGRTVRTYFAFIRHLLATS
jgi:hypothetical protein